MKLIVPASTEVELNKCLDVRKAVFVGEQHVDPAIEVDEKDVIGGDCMHFVVYEDAKPVGAFRITINQNNIARLQRFCILSDYRGQGYGQYAMEFVEGLCMGQRVKKIMFDAQCTAVGFYEKLGYKVYSEEFEEAGMKHVKMSKKLDFDNQQI